MQHICEVKGQRVRTHCLELSSQDLSTPLARPPRQRVSGKKVVYSKRCHTQESLGRLQIQQGHRSQSPSLLEVPSTTRPDLVQTQPAKRRKALLLSISLSTKEARRSNLANAVQYELTERARLNCRFCFRITYAFDKRARRLIARLYLLAIPLGLIVAMLSQFRLGGLGLLDKFRGLQKWGNTPALYASGQ